MNHQVNGRVVSFAEKILNWRWAVIIISLVVVFGVSSGARHLGFQTDYRMFFSDDNPQLQSFEELQRVYTKTDNAMVVVKPKEGNVFTPRVLQAIQEITKEFWLLPYVTRVDSITNFQHTSAVDDDLTVGDLVEGRPEELSQNDLDFVRQVALSEPLLVDRLIAEDGLTTGVNATVGLPGKDAMEVLETTTATRKLIDRMRDKYPDLEIRGSGVVFMNAAFNEEAQNDMMTIIPIMYGILLIAMMVFLRSIILTIAILFVIAFSAASAMGFGGWVGILLSPPSSTVPTIVLTLAIADSIHIIVSMLKAMQRGMNKRSAIIESLRINLQPVFLTSLTTSIGFLALNFSDAPPFRDLGNMAAVGIASAFFYSIFFLPAVLSLLPVKTKHVETKGPDMFEKLGDWVVEKKKPLLAVNLVVVAFCGWMMTKIELNDQFVQYFDHTVEFRNDTEFMLENLTGIYQVEYSLKAEGAGAVNDPEYLEKLSAFTDWLRAQPEVINAYSMSDVYKRLNKNMHGDDENWFKMPEQRDMAAQYLLLYEMSLPYGLDLNDRINIDKSATRVSVTIEDMSTRDIRKFKNKSEQWLRDNTPVYMQTEATSPIVMFAYISQRNIEGMTTGNIIALFLISLCILVALRSVKIGLFSLIPNLTPVVIGFGIWAMVVGEINMSVAIISAVSLGIIVDDSIHFLSKYLRARREKGLNAEDAVRYAFSTVGHALLLTTVILAIGFVALSTSSFQLNSYMGSLTAIVIVSALFADFLLMPSLLMLLDKDKKTKK